MIKNWFLVFFTFSTLPFFPTTEVNAARLTKTGDAFIREFLPEVRKVNYEIRKERQTIRYWRAHLAIKGWLPIQAYQQLLRIAEKYDEPTDTPQTGSLKAQIWWRIQSLAHKVDEIPEEIVLAQAILESGWGKSKAARNTFNFFGLTSRSQTGNPLVTSSGSTFYYLKSYKNMHEGIKDYAITINTHWAYKDFRNMRSEYRRQGKSLDPCQLTQGLLRWSERRERYTAKLRLVIRRYLPVDMESFLAKA